MKSFFGKCVVIFLGIILALILAEILLRIFWHPIKLDLKYRRDDIKWLQENVKLNRYNYRDRDFSLIKPEGVFRIYSLGDSFTFGWYINDASLSYPKMLEKKLQEKFGKEKIEIINASRHGFSFAEDIERLKNDGVLFNPDLITVEITPFDLVNIKNVKPYISNKVIQNLYLYKISLGKIEEMRIAKNTKKTMDLVFQDASGEMEGIKKLFQSYKNLTDFIGAKPLIILFPEYNPSDPDGEYQLASYHYKIKQLAENNGIEIIDLQESLGKYSNKKELILNPTDPHPSILAHNIAADFLFKKIDFEKIINVQKPPFSVNELNVEVGTNLLDYHGIVNLEKDWVFFDDLGGKVKKIFLPNNDDIKMAYLDNYLETIQSFKGDGWPGAKLTYYISSNENKSSFSNHLFGFPVVGISSISAYWREKGALMSEDLDFSNTDIVRDDEQIFVSTNFKKPVEYFKIILDVGVFQLNIENNKIISLAETKILKDKIKNNDSNLNFIIDDEFISLPSFFSHGNSVKYAWINDKLSVVFFDQQNGKLAVGFKNQPNSGDIIEIPVLQDLDDSSVYPSIIYLNK